MGIDLVDTGGHDDDFLCSIIFAKQILARVLFLPPGVPLPEDNKHG